MLWYGLSLAQKSWLLPTTFKIILSKNINDQIGCPYSLHSSFCSQKIWKFEIWLSLSDWQGLLSFSLQNINLSFFLYLLSLTKWRQLPHWAFLSGFGICPTKPSHPSPTIPSLPQYLLTMPCQGYLVLSSHCTRAHTESLQLVSWPAILLSTEGKFKEEAQQQQQQQQRSISRCCLSKQGRML